jgi:hypothetical protein
MLIFNSILICFLNVVEVDDVVLEFPINTKIPFFLFGHKKFQKIRLISALSNVRIYIPDKEQHGIENITLEGAVDNVMK